MMNMSIINYMIDLPNEVLSNIFLFLSQRYIPICSIVCKNWFIQTRQSQYYKTINLYSKTQLKEFMEAATKVKITEKNIPFGHFVQEVIVHEDCYGCILNETIVIELFFCCPNMKKINNTEIYACCPRLVYKYTTDTFFYKRENLYPDSIKEIINDHSIVRNNPTFFSHQSHHIFKSLKYIINYKYNSYDIIQTQTDPQKYEFQPNNHIDNDFDEEEEEEGCFKKIIYFSSSVSWIKLKELYLNFDELNKKTLTGRYKLDENVLEIIASTCPQLESLTMDSFNMCTSNINNHQYKNNVIPAINDKNIQPNNSLKQLHLNGCYIECIFFSLFNRMFPNVIDLNIGLYWDKDNVSDNYYERYKLDLFNMVTDFIYLKKLSTNIKPLIYFFCGESHNCTSLYSTKLWPNDQLYEWFKNNPTQLEVLKTPFDFDTILNNVSSIINTSISTSSTLLLQDNHYKYDIYENLAFLRHLTILDIFCKTKKYRQNILRYLRSDNLNSIVSSSITSLTIHTFEDIVFLYLRCTPEYDDSKMNDFYIDDWLIAFPNLKKLNISFPCKMHLSKNSNTIDHLLPQQLYKPVYPLEELKMQGVYIHLSIDDLKELFKLCPSLRVLSLVKVIFIHTTTINIDIPSSSPSTELLSPSPCKPSSKQSSLFLSLIFSLLTSKASKLSKSSTKINEKTKENNELNYIIIDAPHLNLNRLELLYIDQYGYKKSHGQRLQKQLKVNEIGINNTFQCLTPSFSYPPLNIIVNCKSVDVVHFKDN